MDIVVVAPDNFAEAVHKMIEDNIEANEVVMREDVKRAGKVAAEWLRKNAPYDSAAKIKSKKNVNRGQRKKEGTHYRDGWTSYFSDKMAFLHLCTATVATKHEPNLTHLLEFGHEMFIHGHDTGKRVPAYPHISKAYDIGKKVLESAKVDN